MSDKKDKDLTLLTSRNHKKHKNVQNLSSNYSYKEKFLRWRYELRRAVAVLLLVPTGFSSQIWRR